MTLWFRVDIDFVLGPEFLELPAELRAAWLSLHALSARYGGPIPGLKGWSRGKAYRSLGCYPASCERLALLGHARWVGPDGTDLELVALDVAGIKKARQRSVDARNAANLRWANDADALPTHMQPQCDPPMRPKLSTDADADAHHIREVDIRKDPDPEEKIFTSGRVSGLKATLASGSSTPAPAAERPAGMPDYPPLPDEPPDFGPPPRDNRRREPPRQYASNASVPGSVPARVRKCARCGGGGALIDTHRELLCMGCYSVPRPEGA